MGESIRRQRNSTRDNFTQGCDSAGHRIQSFYWKNYSPDPLLEQLKGGNEHTVANWLDRYETILERRKLAANTYKVRAGQQAPVREYPGEFILE